MSDKRSSLLTTAVVAGVGIGLVGALATLVVNAANEYENERRRESRAVTRVNKNKITQGNTNNETPVVKEPSAGLKITYSCQTPHEGQQLVNEIFLIEIDELFNLLFSKSEFLVDFHKKIQLTDIKYGNWEESSFYEKERHVSYVSSSGYGAITAKETQIMSKHSKSGQLYAIDIHVNASGVMYADTFVTKLHYCLLKEDDFRSKLTVFARIDYKRNHWGFIRSRIDNNVFDGLKDFSKSLLEALKSHENTSRVSEAAKRKKIISIESEVEKQFTDSGTLTETETVRDLTVRNSDNFEVAKRNLKNDLKWEYVWLLVFTVIALLVGIWLYWRCENAVPSAITVTDNVCRISPRTEIEKWYKILRMSIEG